jgi:hypothetical protein
MLLKTAASMRAYLSWTVGESQPDDTYLSREPSR